MRFEENLQTLRKEKGITQEGLAEMLNVSRQAVSKWESGSSYPEIEKLIAISEIFGVTLDSLVKDGETYSGTAVPPGGLFWQWKTQFEYKSKRSLFGLPLVHVNIGYGVKRAKGIVAVGNIATGIFSVGLVSLGAVSVGLLSLGLLSIGTLAVGLLSAGVFSAGFASIGSIAIGWYTLGAIAIGAHPAGALTVNILTGEVISHQPLRYLRHY